jgi:hypothetical protein
VSLAWAVERRADLDHREPERLGPVDREEQRRGPADQGLLVALAELSDVLHQRMVEERPDAVAEVGRIRRVDLGGDAQRPAAAHRDLDGPVDALLRGHAPHEGQVVARHVRHQGEARRRKNGQR